MEGLEETLENVDDFNIEEELESLKRDTKETMEEDRTEYISSVPIDEAEYAHLHRTLARYEPKKYLPGKNKTSLKAEEQNEAMAKFIHAVEVWKDYAEENSDLEFDSTTEAKYGTKKRIENVEFYTETTVNSADDEVPKISVSSMALDDKICLNADFNTESPKYTSLYDKLRRTMDAVTEHTDLTLVS